MGAADVGRRVSQFSPNEENPADGSCGVEREGGGRTAQGHRGEQWGEDICVVREEDVEPEGANGGRNLAG